VIRRFTPFFLISAVVLGAMQPPRSLPQNPIAGEKVTWEFSAFERTPQEPVMILAVYTPDTVLAEIIQPTHSDDAWRFSYDVPEDARFLQLKVEDDNGPLYDDDGFFVGVPVYETQNTPRFDANRLWATLYLGRGELAKRARELTEKELSDHPMNWQALVLLRRMQLAAGEVTEAEVAAELDSLAAAGPDSLEMLRFAAMDFFLASKDFTQKGQNLMELCAQEYPSSPYWSDYQYTIYSYIRTTPERLGLFERNVFANLKGQARETGYFLLMSYALPGRRKQRVEDLGTRFLEEFPTSSLTAPFIVSMLQVKYDTPNAYWAEEMEAWLERYPKNAELNLQLAEYYKDRSWKTALGYYRAAVKNAETSQSARLFAEAAASKKKNFAEAGKYLREAIAEVTPDRYRRTSWWEDFDVRREKLLKEQAALYKTLGWLSYKYGRYEDAVQELLTADSCLVSAGGYDEELYQRLFTASEKAGSLDAKKTALLNLLILKPNDMQTRLVLEDIYRVEYGDSGNFNEWLTQEELNISLRRRINLALPDFPLVTLAGDTIFASRFLGKVLVVNFWATWCEPCKEEIPQLNQLVAEFKDADDVVFLGISNEEPEVVAPFLGENVFLYQPYTDPGGVLTKLFKVEAIPTHMVIDRRGRLQFHHVGALENIKDILAAEINALRKE